MLALAGIARAADDTLPNAALELDVYLLDLGLRVEVEVSDAGGAVVRYGDGTDASASTVAAASLVDYATGRIGFDEFTGDEPLRSYLRQLATVMA